MINVAPHQANIKLHYPKTAIVFPVQRELNFSDYKANLKGTSISMFKANQNSSSTINENFDGVSGLVA